MSAPTDPSNPGLLFGPGPEGWWDSERCSAPTVLRLPDGTWRMYYYGRDATFDRAINFPAGRSGVAESTDGVRWTRVRGPLTLGAVFEPSADPTRFDCGHVGFTDVHWHNGLFW
ncbi:MAG: glycosyl hydrolase, partial [Dehalococcoidia bacterium]|nr:glycosyl hydrolase [Dehalococcoidia bacterium]